MRGSGARRASGIGLALAWHGAGFTGSGEVKLASVASVELTDDHPDPDPHCVDRDGPGHEDDLPAAGGRHARRRVRRGRDRAAGHVDRAGFRPDRRQPDGHGGRRAADPRRRARLRTRSRRKRALLRRLLPGGVASPRRRAVHAVPGRDLRRHDLYRRRLSRLRLGGRGGRVEVDLDTAEVTVRNISATTSGASSIRCWPRARWRAARCRPSATPPSRR